MTKELVFNLIAKNKENLVTISKAVRVDFESILGYYIIFDKMPIKDALMNVSKDIIEEYKDKKEIWDNIQASLVY